jgi:ribosome-associated heat shock protein Hsp15
MEVRIDKWLWAVRLYKSRSLATAACSAGKVRIGGEPLKPSRTVRIGDVITAATGDITRTVRVRALLENRVGAKLVPDYLEDLTPPSEYERPREPNFRPLLLRPKGSGRPTKKDRRKLDQFV